MHKAILPDLKRSQIQEQPRLEDKDDGTGQHCWIYWEPAIAKGNFQSGHSFSSADLGSFSVGVKDVVWLVTYEDGDLFLNGRLKVGAIKDRVRAETIWRRRKLWDGESWPPPFPVPSRARHDFEYQKPRVCIFAEPGTEKPYRFVSLNNVVTHLRFQSKTNDRLTVLAEQVTIPQEVVNPRRITPESGAIMEDLWAKSDT